MLEVSLILLACLVAGTVGYYLGGWRKSSELRRMIRNHQRGHYLGEMLHDETERVAASAAYYDPAKALQELDRYPWDPLSVPTPFVGHAPAPNADARLAINSHQFRAAREVVLPKPIRTLRLFLVGGSTAFGSGAPNLESTIGGCLEAALKEKYAGAGASVELFTVAATAWASTHERIVIENRVSELEPDIVVSLSGYNEAHWAWNKKNVLWFRSYFDSYYRNLVKLAFAAAGVAFPEDALRQEDMVPEVAQVTQALIKNVTLAQYALPPTTSYMFALQPFILASGKALSKREEAILQRWHPEQKGYYLECYKRFREKLSSEARIKGFTFVDLSTAFEPYGGDDEIFLDSAHFGDRGNAILARQMAENLASLVEAKVDSWDNPIA